MSHEKASLVMSDSVPVLAYSPARKEAPATRGNETMERASNVRDLAAQDFSRILGESEKDLPQYCVDAIGKHDFRYRVLARSDRDKVIRDVMARLDSGQLSVTGHQEKWQKGWSENLSDFVENGYDLKDLTPKYIHYGLPIRLFSDYVQPMDSRFELNWYDVFRHWFFSKYMRDANEIFEFGCGPAYNLPILADLFPDKKIYGLDWAEASCEIVKNLAVVHGLNVEGCLLDMFHPDESLPLKQDSGVLTLGALEQLGDRFTVFIDYLVRKAPGICAHMEPLVELYDDEHLPDYLAKRFHQMRNYLGNIVAYLRSLEEEGKVQIIKIHRVPLGSLFHEGYSYIVWRPLRGVPTKAGNQQVQD